MKSYVKREKFPRWLKFEQEQSQNRNLEIPKSRTKVAKLKHRIVTNFPLDNSNLSSEKLINNCDIGG